MGGSFGGVAAGGGLLALAGTVVAGFSSFGAVDVVAPGCKGVVFSFFTSVSIIDWQPPSYFWDTESDPDSPEKVGVIFWVRIQLPLDLLLCPENLEEAVEALLAAVESGEIPESRLDESILRILSMKEARGLLPEM